MAARVTRDVPESLPFSVGAAGLTPLWLLFHGRRRLGALLLAMQPLLFAGEIAARDGLLEEFAVLAHRGFVISAAVVFGLHGNRIAWRAKRYPTVDELRRAERGWTVLGGIVLAVYAVWMILN